MANSKNYNNLSQVEPSLESKDYYCDETFEAELKNVWYRSWIYAGRESEIACQGDFKSLRIGSQNLLLVRNEDGQINVNDLLAIIGYWGSNGPLGDVNEDGIVNVSDLLLIISNWGPCE